MPVRCLIVDDNESFIDVARTFLEQDGVSVLGGASTGSEAVHRVEAMRPDVVLVDIFLGAESGIELAASLAGAGGAPGVILISTHSEAEVSGLIAGSGAAGFLPKTELSASSIRRTLDRRATG